MTNVLTTVINPLQNLTVVADQFAHQGSIIGIRPFGNGNINDTFLVTLDDPSETRFILQRINIQVFRHPHLIMRNMCLFTEHVRDRLQCTPLSRRWDVPQVLFTVDAQDHWQAADGSFWRAISFIDDSESFDTLHDVEHAREVGYALGMFHSLISDLSPCRLADTLEGFHITPLYLQHYNKILAKTRVSQSPEVSYCLQFIRDRQSWASILEQAKASGKLPLRPMHGDPKVNNVMFDTVTGQAVSLVDLDTVKPGLVHYDIGDCLRSGCNTAGEETEHWDTVYFEPDLCRGILQGYLSVANNFLTDHDHAYLYDAICLIAFELGLRFFIDYLAGNVYFKVKYPEHNLSRAIVQFKLAESIEAQERTIRTLIQDLR
ncbi:MAG: aminoglycoside phosphotransferase family protein [Leptolyngbyaceae cyanobacterium RU_5_1]|nr:aminoglycoside phosphotransferase family protein [Leptolyngbyaceae cyanobacterium RU_5_1]